MADRDNQNAFFNMKSTLKKKKKSLLGVPKDEQEGPKKR